MSLNETLSADDLLMLPVSVTTALIIIHCNVKIDCMVWEHAVSNNEQKH